MTEPTPKPLKAFAYPADYVRQKHHEIAALVARNRDLEAALRAWLDHAVERHCVSPTKCEWCREHVDDVSFLVDGPQDEDEALTPQQAHADANGGAG